MDFHILHPDNKKVTNSLRKQLEIPKVNSGKKRLEVIGNENGTLHLPLVFSSPVVITLKY